MGLMKILAAIGLAGAPVVAATAAEPVQVMVLGTYHFNNPGKDLHNATADDVLKPQRQRELEAIAVALAEFRPTKVMVERVAKTPDLVDPGYTSFSPVDLAEKRNESVQIGYRTAARLGLNTVYAIDEQPGEGEPDYFPFQRLMEWAQANGAKKRLNALMARGAEMVSEIERLQKEGSIADVLLEMNRPERTARDQTTYYEMLDIGDTEQQPGADLNAMWYLRNAKIFAKLQKVAEPADRVLVVYGSGHNYWLRHFAQTAPGYVNVDPVPYLERAETALR